MPASWAAEQRLAADELHGDEDAVLDDAHVEHRDHVGVRELGHRLRLAQKASVGVVVVPIGAQQLDRELAIELGIVGGDHHAHATLTNALEHDVAAEAVGEGGAGAAAGWGRSGGGKAREGDGGRGGIEGDGVAGRVGGSEARLGELVVVGGHGGGDGMVDRSLPRTRASRFTGASFRIVASTLGTRPRPKLGLVPALARPVRRWGLEPPRLRASAPARPPHSGRPSDLRRFIE
jgi:hypothetical protein